MSVRVQTADFDIGDECARLAASRDTGALVTFTGLVRSDGGLESLTLEHYPGMTEREIARHVEDAKARWPLLAVSIVHRIGRLSPGERIVFVGTAASHRQDAFDAAMFLMDYLKSRAPFWKLEERSAGSTWVEARDADQRAAAAWSGKG